MTTHPRAAIIAMSLIALALLTPGRSNAQTPTGPRPQVSIRPMVPTLPGVIPRRPRKGPAGANGAEIPEAYGPASGFSIAQLKYGGGGDWYVDETSIQNLLAALKERTSIHVARSERVVVSATEEQLFNQPFLFISGHGNIKFTTVEVERLRAYLLGGGFLWADDDYGMDAAFRRELRRIMPEDSLVDLPFDHEIYRSFYKIEGGCPKVHEHDNKPAQGLGLFHDGRLVCYYTYETDIGDGMEEPTMHNDSPAKREEAFRMAINIVTYALTH